MLLEWFKQIERDCGPGCDIIGRSLYWGRWDHELQVWRGGVQIATYRLRYVL